ncbi:MAG: DUF1289 domain-containing protein [Pseudomonadales bacterium]|nr:DUF1289 domain-containing protein [Pseudomonadales bacterium]
MTEKEEQVMSPCIGICCPDENDICVGCFRTMQEITQWWDMTVAEKKQLILELQSRNKRFNG